MSCDLDVSLAVLDSAGTLVLDLAESAGFVLVDVDQPGTERFRQAATSPWADGDFRVASTRRASEYTFTVRLEAASWPAIVGKRLALIDAIEQPSWLLREVVEGVTTLYRCDEGVVDPRPLDAPRAMNGKQYVTVRVPVQPHPTVTGAV